MSTCRAIDATKANVSHEFGPFLEQLKNLESKKAIVESLSIL